MTKPKTDFEEDAEYDPSGKPVFFTGGARLRHPSATQSEMMDSRIRYIELWYSMPKTRAVAKCASCFASCVFGWPE